MMSVCSSLVGVNFDHLGKEMSVRFLHHKVTVFSLLVSESKSPWPPDGKLPGGPWCLPGQSNQRSF